jgi:hypothetical protein
VTDALRAGTPLTPGQLAADAVERWLTTDAFLAAAEDYIAHARASGRPVEPVLERRASRQLLLDALHRAQRLGDRDRVIGRLARELDSGHQTTP